MNYPIEKGIQGPIIRVRRFYPYNEMEVGDSFFVPGAKISHVTACSTYHARHNPGKRFTARTMEGGVRVWRVE